MKIYNSPEQARNLREIEEAAASPVINTIPKVNGTVQSVCSTEEGEEEGEKAEAQITSQKSRKKKNKEKV